MESPKLRAAITSCRPAPKPRVIVVCKKKPTVFAVGFLLNSHKIYGTVSVTVWLFEFVPAEAVTVIV